jgi:pimeloyl-ACP methyl ester carboxylesterase
MRINRNDHLIVSASVLAIAAMSAFSCTKLNQILGFKEQLEEAEQIGRIEGRIETEAPTDGALVVVLARPSDVEGGQPVGLDTYVRINPGSYVFPVAAGRYQLGAYQDRNQNGLLDPGELARRIKTSPILEVGPGGTARDDIVIPKDGVIEELKEPINLFDIVARTPREQQHFSLWAWSVQGTICEDLDAPDFGSAAGERGLWEIMDFLNDRITGVYFLEPYDPDRIPVLLVHGIGGYPQEFSKLIDEMDRSRFQPWFYFYPSGFGLDGLSTHLQTLLTRLQVKHGFDEMAIVAHSMGGLVSRGAILKYQQETGRDDIRLFATISTPWGGDVKARRSGDAPIALPLSFQDMNPASEYLRWVFYEDEGSENVKSLPDHVEFHMIFGFRMSGSSAIADDGTVSVASQARLEAQEQAQSIRALDYGHVPILHSPEVIGRINSLLEQRFD